jgi:hypothetical protein
MKQSLFLTILAFLAVMLVGCGLFTGEEPVGELDTPEEQEPTTAEQPEPEETPEEQQVEAAPEPQTCSSNADCDSNTCVDGSCTTLTQIFEATCDQTCTLKEVQVEAGDQIFNYPPGKGSYIAAGAINWEIARVPAFCQPNTMIVPFKITKKSYGDILSEEFITVKESETSTEITHPDISSASLTLEVKSTTVECS